MKFITSCTNGGVRESSAACVNVHRTERHVYQQGSVYDLVCAMGCTPIVWISLCNMHTTNCSERHRSSRGWYERRATNFFSAGGRPFAHSVHHPCHHTTTQWNHHRQRWCTTWDLPLWFAIAFTYQPLFPCYCDLFVIFRRNESLTLLYLSLCCKLCIRAYACAHACAIHPSAGWITARKLGTI